MKIRISKYGDHLDHEAFCELAKAYYSQSLETNEAPAVTFDLRGIKRFELFELSMLVAWSAKIRALEKPVSWVFDSCRPLSSPKLEFENPNAESDQGYEDLVWAIEQRAGVEAKCTIERKFEDYERRVRERVKAGETLDYAYQKLAQIENDLINEYPAAQEITSVLAEYVRSELDGMRVIGYAKSLGLFGLLRRIGCTILPNNWPDLAQEYRHSEVVGTLDYKWVDSLEDAQNQTDFLSDVSQVHNYV